MNIHKTSRLSGTQSVPAAPLDHVEGTVYFITCDHPDFPIKIWFATAPKARFMELQTSLPYSIVPLVLVSGTRRYERQVHMRFKEYRLRGEWFRRAAPIMDMIDRIKAKISYQDQPLPAPRRKQNPHHEPDVPPDLDAIMDANRQRGAARP